MSPLPPRADAVAGRWRAALQEAQGREAALRAELAEALERQAATAEIFRVLGGAPADLQDVLEAVSQRACWLCQAANAQIMRVDGDEVRVVARYGPGESTPLSRLLSDGRGHVSVEAVIGRRTIHVLDLASGTGDEFQGTRAEGERYGYRTIAATPLLRQGEPIGALSVRREDARPFSEPHLRLLETFAAQAAIAIENARLSAELEERQRELDGRNAALAESLDQQTASADILRVIASGPTDLDGVLQQLLRDGARLYGSDVGGFYRYDGAALHLLSSIGLTHEAQRYLTQHPPPVTTGSTLGRAVLLRRTVHVPDWLLDPAYEYAGASRSGFRTLLAVPLLRNDRVVGVFSAARYTVAPFTDRQIALARAFADQAVIAIENVRLFQELEVRTRELARSVEELTALGEVSQAVSSTLDVDTVLARIVDHAPAALRQRRRRGLRVRRGHAGPSACAPRTGWMRRWWRCCGSGPCGWARASPGARRRPGHRSRCPTCWRRARTRSGRARRSSPRATARSWPCPCCAMSASWAASW